MTMKKEFKSVHLLYFIVLASTLLAFQMPNKGAEHKVPLIVNEKIEEEIAAYYVERMKICKLDALTRAEDYVDSIIENKIQLVIAKGIYFPNKPTKPNFPKEIKINDSTKIEPVIKGKK